jgi:hypothetical protein
MEFKFEELISLCLNAQIYIANALFTHSHSH